jgi:hypothetical protein
MSSDGLKFAEAHSPAVLADIQPSGVSDGRRDKRQHIRICVPHIVRRRRSVSARQQSPRTVKERLPASHDEFASEKSAGVYSFGGPPKKNAHARRADYGGRSWTRADQDGNCIHATLHETHRPRGAGENSLRKARSTRSHGVPATRPGPSIHLSAPNLIVKSGKCCRGERRIRSSATK